MENLEIDNEYLNEMADILDTIIMSLKVDSEELRKNNADIFEQYMAYIRSKGIITIMVPLMLLSKEACSRGFMLNNDIFKTKKYHEHGWSDSKIEHVDFFVNPKTSENDEKDMPDALKKILGVALFQAIKG